MTTAQSDPVVWQAQFDEAFPHGLSVTVGLPTGQQFFTPRVMVQDATATTLSLMVIPMEGVWGEQPFMFDVAVPHEVSDPVSLVDSTDGVTVTLANVFPADLAAQRTVWLQSEWFQTRGTEE